MRFLTGVQYAHYINERGVIKDERKKLYLLDTGAVAY